MIYYLIIAIFPLVVNFLHSSVNKKRELEYKSENKNLGLIVLAVLPMFLLYAFRSEHIGPDTSGYVKSFLLARDVTFLDLFTLDDRFELGFRIFEKLIAFVTDSYTIYFIICGIILFGVLVRFAYKYTGNPYVFLFLFCALGSYNFYLTGLRQSLAMTICLLSIDFIKNKKPIKFVLTIAVACLFHKSAVLFLIAYPFSNVKFNSITAIMYIVLAAVLLIGFSFFQELFNEFLGYGYEIEETSNGQIFFLITVGLFVYSLLNNNEITKLIYPQPYGINLNLSAITVIFWTLRLISRTAERPSLYFIPFLMALVSWGFCNEKKDNFLYKFMVIGICLALYVYRSLGVTFAFFWG